MSRNFEEWISTFTDNIADYKYYIDFEAIYKKLEGYKLELNIMNALVGSKNIEKEFEEIVKKYPEVIKCIPVLLAIRERQIKVLDKNGNKFEYDFEKINYSIDQYKVFMKETGLFELIQNKLINNVYDYALGVEAGLNANARKNRGGRLIEDIVESFIQKLGYKKDETYFKEMYLQEIKSKWNLDVSQIPINRADFVIKTDEYVYIIQANFYSSGGTKLIETAKDCKMIAEETNKIDKVKFIWITDGMGWLSARNSLKEAFDNMDNIYNINDLKNGVMKVI